jgi:DNA-binding Xre family transcriptional regulator
MKLNTWMVTVQTEMLKRSVRSRELATPMGMRSSQVSILFTGRMRPRHKRLISVALSLPRAVLFGR